MKTKLIDGKAVSSALREGLKEKCAKLRAETGVVANGINPAALLRFG